MTTPNLLPPDHPMQAYQARAIAWRQAQDAERAARIAQLGDDAPRCSHIRAWYSHTDGRRYHIRCGNPADPASPWGFCSPTPDGPHSHHAQTGPAGEPIPADDRAVVKELAANHTGPLGQSGPPYAYAN